MKILLYLLVVLTLITMVNADKIILLDLNYNEGVLSLNRQIVQEGYCPERGYQEGNYELLVLDELEEVYSFNFEVPRLRYSDISTNSSIDGSVEEMDKFNFTLIVPFYNGTILITKEGKKVLSIHNEKENSSILPLFVLIFLIVLLIIFFVILHRNRRNKPYQFKGYSKI